MILAAALALAACGGGGSDSPTTPPANAGTAEGAYSGTITSGTATSAATMIVTETGSFYALYGQETNNVLYVSGLVTGKGTSTNGVFTASAKDFYLNNPPVTESITANYVQGVSMSGTVTSSTASGTFTATSAAALPYVYGQPASMADAVGTWPITSLGGQTGTVTIASDGKATTSSGGCISTGTVTPADGSRNYFNVTGTSGPSPCLYPGMKFVGIAVVSPVENSTLKQLVYVGVSEDGTKSSVAVGAK
jgi:hypothetical protein